MTKMEVSVKVLVIQACPTLCNAVDSSPPNSSVHGILQARILEWTAIPFSRGFSQTRGWTIHWVHLSHQGSPMEVNRNQKQKNIRKILKIRKPNNTFLNNLWIKEETKRQNQKHFELNENTVYQNLWDY